MGYYGTYVKTKNKPRLEAGFVVQLRVLLDIVSVLLAIVCNSIEFLKNFAPVVSAVAIENSRTGKVHRLAFGIDVFVSLDPILGKALAIAIIASVPFDINFDFHLFSQALCFSSITGRVVYWLTSGVRYYYFTFAD